MYYFILNLLTTGILIRQAALIPTHLVPSAGGVSIRNDSVLSLVRFNKPIPDPGIRDNCSSCRAGDSFNGNAIAVRDLEEKPNYSKAQLDLTKNIRYVVFPILLASCTLGNIMNVIVLTHQNHKSTTNSYMLSVAMADVLYMWLSLPCSYLLDYFGHNSSYAAAIWPHRGPIEWARRAGAVISDWIIFLFSIERLCVTMWPLYFRGFQTARHGWINCGIILVIACMFMMSHAVLNYSFDQALDKDAAPWRQKWFQMQQHAEVADLIINMFGLFAINACIIALFIRKSKISISANAGAGISQERVKSSSGLLFGCSTLFLLTHLPWLVHTCLQIMSLNGGFHYTENAFEFAYPLLQTCMDVNYSLNCYVYLVVSRQFRKDLRIVFREHRRILFKFLHIPYYQDVVIPPQSTLRFKSQMSRSQVPKSKVSKTKSQMSNSSSGACTAQSTNGLITSGV